MSIFQAIVLGIVQGLTEFIPVSSSGHLVLTPWLFGWDLPDELGKTFDVALHLGTFFAVLVYFRAEVAGLFSAVFRTFSDRRLVTFEDRLPWLLLLASVPAAVFGLVGEDFIEENLDRPLSVGITLGLFGLLMLYVDRSSKTSRKLDTTTWGDAMFIGFAQAIALAPGTSRSGVTLTAGVYREFSREDAVRFSFLMSLPVIGGAGLLKGAELVSDGFPAGIGVWQFVIGITASFLTGYAAVSWLLRFLRTRTLVPFVIYRLVLSAIVIGGALLE